MVIDLKQSAIKQPEGTFQVYGFLEEFALLRGNLKDAFRCRKSAVCSYATIAYHAGKMKVFLLKHRAKRAVELFAEYEKYIAIGDHVTCSRLEKEILSELDIFREFAISLFA